MSKNQSINDIISIARLAPSVHNAQPWNVKQSGDMLIISENKKRALQYSDPTGRQTAISLGIFAEACLIAMDSLGLKHLGLSLGKNNDIVIKLAGGSIKGPGNDQDAGALRKRFTDRSVYKKARIRKDMIKQIQDSWSSGSVEIIAVEDRQIINRCAQLTRQGLSLALSSPDFREELSEYMVPSAKTPYGIPLSTLENGKVKSLFVKQLIKTGRGQKQQADLEYKRWKSSSIIVFVLSDGDSKEYWVESGRAYLRASLEIEKLGLQQATSAAVVEASDFHEDIEKMLGTQKRIQCMIRAGKGASRRRQSGRFSVESLIAST